MVKDAMLCITTMLGVAFRPSRIGSRAASPGVWTGQPSTPWPGACRDGNRCMMRREKRRAEFEEGYRADRERKRAAKRKRKMDSLPVAASHDGSDGSAAREPSARYETRSPSTSLSE